MAPNPKQKPNSDAGRTALPFEPKRRKPAEKKAEKTPAPASSTRKPSGKTASRANTGIPDAVSKRMVRRMAAFCGVPTVLGISSFFVSYLAVTQGVGLPTSAVLLVSLGLFGLGVIGLSYGVLSASWEEEPGSLVGFSEFRTNFGRMTSAWKSAKQDKS
ncbi:MULTISPECIES: PAM68 family protein [unclassified Leptolyngbya]|uniref:PAM68 family protein n=1 Tax=unclassified Leptolyngbya TaxID=2650499 RepID=UPI001688706C|nr:MULTISPECIES: PAM68 family protein [unclassified Leptolyngbya]MBD1911506.1 PAM68 family protein [Leptolyngbya sp. FACHB-8]MBD2155253.1 PAM68 family protein [Leptolyngbya sp. FACHB-16]